jgi:hypothetical protein
MRHFEYPYNDNNFWFRHFIASVMLAPFSWAWWISVLVSPLIILVVAVFYEVMFRKWLTTRMRWFKDWIFKKKQIKK